MTTMLLAASAAAGPWAAWHLSPDDVFLTLTGRASGPNDDAAVPAGAAGKDAA